MAEPLAQLNKTQFAKAAGISVTTLNRYLAGQSVDPDTEGKILEADKQLNMLGVVGGKNTKQEAAKDKEEELLESAPDVTGGISDTPAPEPELPPAGDTSGPAPANDQPDEPPAHAPDDKAPKRGEVAGVKFELVNVREAGTPRASPTHKFTLKFIGSKNGRPTGKNLCLDSHPTMAEVEAIIRRG